MDLNCRNFRITVHWSRITAVSDSLFHDLGITSSQLRDFGKHKHPPQKKKPPQNFWLASYIVLNPSNTYTWASKKFKNWKEVYLMESALVQGAAARLWGDTADQTFEKCRSCTRFAGSNRVSRRQMHVKTWPTSSPNFYQIFPKSPPPLPALPSAKICWRGLKSLLW